MKRRTIGFVDYVDVSLFCGEGVFWQIPYPGPGQNFDDPGCRLPGFPVLEVDCLCCSSYDCVDDDFVARDGGYRASLALPP